MGIDALTKNPLGRAIYRPIQKILHSVRERRYPGVPIEHEVLEIECRGRHFGVEVRRWCPSDQMAVDQCFRCEQYELPAGPHRERADRLYREIVASGKKPLIVDCGANIGASVLWFSVRFPEAAMLAVEPAPDNFALLSKNCSAVGAELRQAGIGPADGKGWLGDAATQMAYRTNSQGDGLAIEVVSLATLLADKPEKEYTPFLLKVDIEGAEGGFFAGDGAVLRRFPLIIMEPHDWLLPGEGTSLSFFRFHAGEGREFTMMHENVVSMAMSAAAKNGAAHG